MKTRWYKDAVVYQIYPKSFCDSNGDGIGDIQGIISKLDYIKSLGVDAVWISPMYKSPQKDNGYDVSDYRDIDPMYGTLADFKQLVHELKKRDIKLIMDLVVNHTSSEHKWFVSSKSSLTSKYRDYYIWRKGRNNDGKTPPNNWTSRFSGSAWKYDETTNEWYLHLFTEDQPDLNWNNPRVREEVVNICKYWLKLGVDGFRCDVITYVAKDQKFKNGKPHLALVGDEYFVMAPPWHLYMKQLSNKIWNKYDTLIVAEGAGANYRNVYEATSEISNEFDSFITFEHLEVDYKYSFLPVKFNLPKFKRILRKWQQMPRECWPTLYLENHDQPRSTSRYIKDPKYAVEGAKMLCVCMQFQRGTPYIYQGQELGMTNCYFEWDEYRDGFVPMLEKTIKKIFPPLMPIAKKVLQNKARDNARTPMQWTDDKYAGFSTHEPWIKVNENKDTINVRKEENDPNSVLNFYRQVLEIRKNNEVIQNGAYIEYQKENSDLFIYERRYESKSFLVICNFKPKNVKFRVPKALYFENSAKIISNYQDSPMLLNDCTLRPYEAIVYCLDDAKEIF